MFMDKSMTQMQKERGLILGAGDVSGFVGCCLDHLCRSLIHRRNLMGCTLCLPSVLFPQKPGALTGKSACNYTLLLGSTSAFSGFHVGWISGSQSAQREFGA